MDLSDPARRVLSHLYAVKDAYLFGRRDSDTPLALIDNASARSPAADFVPSIPRSVVDELFNSGYLDSGITGAEESVKITFTFSDKGRQAFRQFSLNLVASGGASERC
jgi:hypothetical protein